MDKDTDNGIVLLELGSDTPHIQKRYDIILTRECEAMTSDTLPCNLSTANVVEVVGESELKKCVEDLHHECEVLIQGSWNYTRPFPPEVCASTFVGSKLPVPEAVPDASFCTYLPFTFYGLLLSANLSPEKILDVTSGRTCDDYYNNDPYHCQPRIEWSDDAPDNSCGLPVPERSKIMSADDFSAKSHGHPWPVHEGIWEDTRINFSIDLERHRPNRYVRGFILSIGGIAPTWNTGMYYAANLRFRCTIDGTLNAFGPLTDNPKFVPPGLARK